MGLKKKLKKLNPAYKSDRKNRAELEREAAAEAAASDAGMLTRSLSSPLTDIAEDSVAGSSGERLMSGRQGSTKGLGPQKTSSTRFEPPPLPTPKRQLEEYKDFKVNTKLKQQSYKVDKQCWQSQKCMLGFGPIFAAVFIAFGAVLIEDSEPLVIAKTDYACFEASPPCACDGLASCTINLTVPEHDTGSLVLMYELSGVKQNHRRYLKSLVHEQLRYPEEPYVGPNDEGCLPRDNGTANDGRSRLEHGRDVFGRIDKGAIGNPCGLHTAWVYDDVVTVLGADGEALGEEWQPADFDDVYSSDVYNSSSLRFIGWMRTSPYTLRKPLLMFEDGLAPGRYAVAIDNHYDTAIFRGTKRLVLASYGSNGSKEASYALGVVSCIVGAFGFVVGVVAVALGGWKKSPLRKKCHAMLAELEEQHRMAGAAVDARASQRHAVPWLEKTRSSVGGADDLDDAITRGIDLIERYAHAPTIEALEQIIAGEGDGGVVGLAAKARRGLIAATKSMHLGGPTTTRIIPSPPSEPADASFASAAAGLIGSSSVDDDAAAAAAASSSSEDAPTAAEAGTSVAVTTPRPACSAADCGAGVGAEPATPGQERQTYRA